MYIPQITDPLGRYWSQPDSATLEMDETHVLMETAIFNRIAEYSTTLPTAVYPGKMWRAHFGDDWYLCWYAKSADPDFCDIHRRLILLV
jgi:hypothetical protein